MAATATIRQLRNQFPKVKKLLDAEGEVVVTDRGTPRYRLTRYDVRRRTKTASPKDYLAELKRHQPRPISRAAAQALHDDDRGDR